MIFHIAIKDLKVIFRDKRALIFMILMPLVLIMIIGASFSNMFENNLKVDKFTLGVVNNDNGTMSQVFINNVLRQSIPDTFVVDKNKADKMLKEEKAPSIIYIPSDFTRKVMENKPVQIEVKSNVKDQIESSMVTGISKGFSEVTSLSYEGASAGLKEFEKQGISINVSDMNGAIDKRTAVMIELQKKIGHINFKNMDTTKNKVLSGFQFYSTTMLVMFLLFGAINGTRKIIEERETLTLGRIMAAKPSKTVLILGKFLGLMAIITVQAMILILFTHFAYGVEWGSSIPGLVLVTLCSAFTVAAFGMLIAAIAKTSGAADGLGQITVQTFTLLSGGMVPIYIFPSSMKVIAKFTLNWWAVKGYQDLMLGKGVVYVLPNLGVLLILGMVCLGIGIWRFRVE